MKRFVDTAFFCVLVAVFNACSDVKDTAGTDEQSEGVVAIAEKTVSGVSQKGPFVNGSSVTVQELDGETLAQTGLGFEGKIKNDMGEFSINVKRLESQYALLKATGFYRNEVTGERSNSQVTLYALTDLSDRDEVNVNLLTHLTYERSLYLTLMDSLSVKGAKKRAESEVFKSFEIEGDFSPAEDLNIFGESEQSAALLALSVLMQGDLSEAAFSERLADYAADIETDGIWNDVKTATAVADWASNQGLNGGLARIRSNVYAWGMLMGVPNFEKYVNNFWWQNYGLGLCEAKREGMVRQNINELSESYGSYFICENMAWRLAAVVEYDTYEQVCDEDGKIVKGTVTGIPYDCDINAWRTATEVEEVLGGCTERLFEEVIEAIGTHYICTNREWRIATDVEKDTFGWKDSTDGAIKEGNVTGFIYVFDNGAWRSASDVEAHLGGCVATIADSVGKVGSTYYTCKLNQWVESSVVEYDTYHWISGKDGDSQWGNVNRKSCYVFENGEWRLGNGSDCLIGLRGCTMVRQDTVGLGSDNVWYKCDVGNWRVATNIEKDTATWGAGEFDGEVRAGQVNDKVFYIYGEGDKAWRTATTLEYDTYQRECSEDGKIVDGRINPSFKYVCDDGAFRVATENDVLAGVGCTNYTEGEFKILSGQYSYYKCESSVWNFTTEKLNKGVIIDERDGHEYKTVGVKSQLWMAENLNYNPGQGGAGDEAYDWSWCYANDLDKCDTYGRYYTWAAAMDSAMTGCGYGSICSLALPVQGVCPSGWHLPSMDEWDTLINAVGMSTAGIKSQNGWEEYGVENTNAFGFSALAAGDCSNGSFYNRDGLVAYFWSSDAKSVYLRFDDYGFFTSGITKDSGYSIRCLRD